MASSVHTLLSRILRAIQFWWEQPIRFRGAILSHPEAESRDKKEVEPGIWRPGEGTLRSPPVPQVFSPKDHLPRQQVDEMLAIGQLTYEIVDGIRNRQEPYPEVRLPQAGTAGDLKLAALRGPGFGLCARPPDGMTVHFP